MIDDTKRLDFVLEETCVLHIFSTPKGERYSLYWLSYGEMQSEMYETPREAIDAAIKSLEEKTNDN